MAEKLNGRMLSTSIVSKAKYELGLKSQYGLRRSKKRKKPTYEYWAKVVIHIGRKYKVDAETIRRVRINRSFFHF